VEDVVCRTGCAGRGVQDVVCRTGCAGRSVQDVVCRTWCAGRGVLDKVLGMRCEEKSEEDHIWRIKGQHLGGSFALFSIGKEYYRLFFEDDDLVDDDAGVLFEPAQLLLPGHLLLLPPLGPQPASSCSLLQQDPQERKPKLSVI
jgi:hypothetical protein